MRSARLGIPIFLVPISGTPIVSRIPIPCSIPKIPVGFYFCSTDPCVAIFKDKLQPDVDGSVTWNCVSNLIGSPIGQEEAMLCQETFNNLDKSHARTAACANISL